MHTTILRPLTVLLRPAPVWLTVSVIRWPSCTLTSVVEATAVLQAGGIALQKSVWEPWLLPLALDFEPEVLCFSFLNWKMERKIHILQGYHGAQ